MVEWRGIETAPKDGTIILVWDATQPRAEYGSESGPYLANYNASKGWGDWRIFMDGQHVPATHWMPLPEPPKT